MEERHPYLTIDNPADLHAAVEAVRQAGLGVRADYEQMIDQHTLASARAHAYAPHNLGLLKADTWTAKAVNEMTYSDSIMCTGESIPELGKAYIVLAGEQYRVDRLTRGSRWQASELRTWHMAFPLREDGGPLYGPHRGLCDRCWISEAVRIGRRPDPRMVYPVHIAKFRLVAELHICGDCLLVLNGKSNQPVVIAGA